MILNLYIKDMLDGTTRKYGTNKHDSLVIEGDGKTLSYYNLQNGDGSNPGDYKFCDNPEGILPCDNKELIKSGMNAYANFGGIKSDKILEQIKEIVNGSDDLIHRDADYRLKEIKEVLDGIN